MEKYIKKGTTNNRHWCVEITKDAEEKKASRSLHTVEGFVEGQSVVKESTFMWMEDILDLAEVAEQACIAMCIDQHPTEPEKELLKRGYKTPDGEK